MAGGAIKVSGVSDVARGYRVTSASGDEATVTTPSAGGAIDGVTVRADDVEPGPQMFGIPATPGMPVMVEAGGAFSEGDDLEVQADGQFVTASGGKVVARTLEDAVASQSLVWAVFV